MRSRRTLCQSTFRKSWINLVKFFVLFGGARYAASWWTRWPRRDQIPGHRSKVGAPQPELMLEKNYCKMNIVTKFYYRKRGSASYIVREVLSVRERERERERDTERERERRKWRHQFRAIGDEFTLSLAKNSHNWRWAYTFPCQKFAPFVSPFTLPVSPFTERSPLWRWNSQWVHTFHCQKFLRPLCSPSFKWHEPHDEWSKTQDKWSNPAQSFCSSHWKTESN